jgi:hypothetical protein
MNNDPNSQTGVASEWNELTQRTEQYARDEPGKAVGLAFLAGLVLTVLPVGSIIAGVLRVSFTLLRPALLVLGVMKAYEEIQKRGDS